MMLRDGYTIQSGASSGERGSGRSSGRGIGAHFCGVIFAGVKISIHANAAVLFVIAGLLRFRAAALLTELQRIRARLLMGLPRVE